MSFEVKPKKLQLSKLIKRKLYRSHYASRSQQSRILKKVSQWKMARVCSKYHVRSPIAVTFCWIAESTTSFSLHENTCSVSYEKKSKTSSLLLLLTQCSPSKEYFHDLLEKIVHLVNKEYDQMSRIEYLFGLQTIFSDKIYHLTSKICYSARSWISKSFKKQKIKLLFYNHFRKSLYWISNPWITYSDFGLSGYLIVQKL